jgi:hypothetical protein
VSIARAFFPNIFTVKADRAKATPYEHPFPASLFQVSNLQASQGGPIFSIVYANLNSGFIQHVPLAR